MSNASTTNAKGKTMTNATSEIFGEVIYAYTRKQAIEDGVLVDLMQGETIKAVKEAGFKIPVAVTSEVFFDCIALTPKAEEICNDLQGRLWDILWMLKNAIRRASNTTEIVFQLHCVINQKKPTMTTLKAVCGPSDDDSPCITIMYPHQD